MPNAARNYGSGEERDWRPHSWKARKHIQGVVSLFSSEAMSRTDIGFAATRRLDNLDAFLQIYEPGLFAPTNKCELSTVFDVGFGDAIDTFTDFAERLAPRRSEGTLRVIGTESDAERLETGRKAIAGQLEGDRSLALRAGEEAGWFVLPLGVAPSPDPIVVLRILCALRSSSMF